MHSKNDKF